VPEAFLLEQHSDEFALVQESLVPFLSFGLVFLILLFFFFFSFFPGRRPSRSSPLVFLLGQVLPACLSRAPFPALLECRSAFFTGKVVGFAFLFCFFFFFGCF